MLLGGEVSENMVALCGDCLYPMNECEHGREFKNG